MIKLSTYVTAQRPWSFTCSLVPVILGCTLAYKVTNEFSFLIFVLTSITALSVHAAGNIVNTFFDYMRGIDSKKSDDRTLVDKKLTEDEIINVGKILYSIGMISFFLLAYVSPAKIGLLALVYFGGLSSSFLYTGGIGLKYIALGDILIIITFGPVTVLFSYMAQTGNINWGTILYALPVALHTEAILHSNNTRDLQSDLKAGIITLAILLGESAAKILYALFLFSPYTIFVIWGMKYSNLLLIPLITIPEAFRTEKIFRNISKQNIPQRTAMLSLYVGLLYVAAVGLSDVNKLPCLKS